MATPTIDVAMATVEPISRCRLTCSRNTCRSVDHVGSSSMPKRTASFWIVASSDAWYCGARAANFSRLSSATNAISASAATLPRMASA